MPTDRNGLPLTVASDSAATAYRDGVDRLLAAWPGAVDALDSAIAEDPGFALARAARVPTALTGTLKGFAMSNQRHRSEARDRG